MLIQNREQFDDYLNLYLDGNNERISIDTETTTIDNKGQPELIGLSIYNGEHGAYYPFRHMHDLSLYPSDNLPIEWLLELQPIFGNKAGIFHNAKFDLKVLRQEGFKLNPNWFDSMIISHMVNENEYNYGLKYLGKKYISDEADEEQKHIKKLVRLLGSWEAIPPIVMGKYAVKDVELTWHLFELMWDQLGKEELTHLWPRERQYSEVLIKIEERGIPIDPDRAKDLAWQCQVGIENVKKDLDFDPASADQVATKLFYPKPKGLGYMPEEFGKRKTKNWPLGIPKSGAPTLEKFDHPTVDKVLEYRGYVKAKSTWFEGFVDVLWSDGRVHPTYRQHGTVTSRLSCADPNMQQLPRTQHDGIKAKVKSMLNPAGGSGLYEFDYSQMEYRLAVCYGKDEHAIKAYMDGSDLHTLTAELLGIPRQDAKTLNFAILYGAGPTKIAEMLGISWNAAKSLINSFWEKYPGIQSAVDAAEASCEGQGWVPLWNGRRRRLWKPDEMHKAFNSVVQGGGAQIIETAMINIDEKHPDIQMVAQVHDSIWVECRIDEIESIAKKVVTEMEWPSEHFGLPFVVDMKRIA